MSAYMDFSCPCGKRFGQLVRDDDERVLCPKCGRETDLAEVRRQVEEARKSILDKPPRQEGGDAE